MSDDRIPLEVLDIPRPCPADWNAMRGDERVRFCSQCNLHVYNLSAMTRQAAQTLVAQREGRLCVRFYRRADGTVITRDCGGGVKLAARRAGRLESAATAVVLTAALAPLGLWRTARASPTHGRDGAGRTAVEVKPVEAQGEAVAGGLRPPAFLGKVAAPAAVMGDLMQTPPPTNGDPAPKLAPPPAATQRVIPPATQPSAP